MKYTKKEQVLINFPFSNRTKERQNRVGDYTKSIIYRCDIKRGVAFNEFCKAMHKKYKEDIKHVDLDGVSVQRILKNHCQGNEKYPVPLVFSPSFEIPMLSEVFLNEIGDLSYIISQTPGVWLDAQVYQLKQDFFFSWVILEGILDETEKVKRLSEFDTKPQLDALKDAKEVMKPNVGVVARIIPEDLYFKICEKGRENAVTPFSILLTAFGKALAKYSDNSKFLLNLPVSYRPMELEGVENLVGLCSNFILFGFDDSRSIGFLEQIEDNQNKLFSSREEGMLLSGTDVLKKVKQTKKEEIIAPVVFTSTVGGLRQGEAKFKKNMTLSYTSQVWLEGLLTEVPELVQNIILQIYLPFS